MSDFSCAVEEAAAGERAIVRLGGDLHVSNAFAIHQKLVSLAEKYSALDMSLEMSRRLMSLPCSCCWRRRKKQIRRSKSPLEKVATV